MRKWGLGWSQLVLQTAAVQTVQTQTFQTAGSEKNFKNHNSGSVFEAVPKPWHAAPLLCLWFSMNLFSCCCCPSCPLGTLWEGSEGSARALCQPGVAPGSSVDTTLNHSSELLWDIASSGLPAHGNWEWPQGVCWSEGQLWPPQHCCFTLPRPGSFSYVAGRRTPQSLSPPEWDRPDVGSASVVSVPGLTLCPRNNSHFAGHVFLLHVNPKCSACKIWCGRTFPGCLGCLLGVDYFWRTLF